MRRRFVRFLIASARLLPDEREGIWSIPRPLQIIYFPLFIGICVPLLIDIVREVTALRPDAGLVTVARATASEFAAVAVGAAIVTLMAVQGGYILMMAIYHAFANRFIKPVIEEHRAEGIAAGIEKSNRAWSEWNQRRLDTEALGIPFDEPPPDQQSPGRNGREE